MPERLNKCASRWLAAGNTGDAIFGLLSTQTCLRLRRPGPSRDDGRLAGEKRLEMALPCRVPPPPDSNLPPCMSTPRRRNHHGSGFAGRSGFLVGFSGEIVAPEKKGRYECHVWEACSCSQRPPGGRSGSGTAAWARPRRGVPQISDIAMRSRLPSRGLTPRPRHCIATGRH